jgi:hypothetical protein
MAGLPRFGMPEDKIEDRDFGDLILTDVDDDRAGAESWSVRVGSTCFGIPKAPGIKPPASGDRVRMWPSPNFGARIRGVALRGVVVHFRTDDEFRLKLAQEASERDAKKRAEYEATGKAEQQARYEELPPVFQRRLDKYRANNPDFGWTFEGYELFCCEQAVVFAREAVNAAETGENDAEVAQYFDGKADAPSLHSLRWLSWWSALNSEDFDYDYQRQKSLMPGFDDGHSGNTFGSAVNLATLWLLGAEEAVVRRYGSLAPLVGSDAYGDVPVEGTETA